MDIHERHLSVETEPLVDLAAQMRELRQLREMVRQAQLSVRKSQSRLAGGVREVLPARREDRVLSAAYVKKH